MKFICITEHLKRALGNADRFTGKNITLPVLGNVLLEAEQNTLRIMSTNLESALQVTLHGNLLRSGRLCVPAKVLSSFIQSIGDEKTQIEERSGNMFIKTETRDTRINGVSSEDFPLIPKIKKSHSFVITACLLQEGIERVLPAVSLSEFKPELGGVFVNVSSSCVRLAATDTFRLAEKIIPFESQTKRESFSFILPYKIAQEIVRVLGGEEEVTISIGENQLLLETDGLKIISRLTEGNFPEYGGIIPKNFETSCFVNRDIFINAVRASSIFASKLQEVTTAIKGKNIEVISLNQEIGEYKNVLPCAPSGKDMVVGFNYRYLLDGLESTKEDEIFLGLNSEQSPSLIKNKSDNSFLYVLMPIRLS